MKASNPIRSGLFLAIVIFQGFHSLEEYFGQLWENFPPARFLCGLVSDDLETGFMVINIGLFVAGMVVWFFIVRKDRSFTHLFIGLWIAIELINGVGHPLWSLYRGKYEPGVITAPLLLITAFWLLKVQIRQLGHN